MSENGDRLLNTKPSNSKRLVEAIHTEPIRAFGYDGSDRFQAMSICVRFNDDHHGCDPRVTGQAAGQQLEQVVQVANHADLPMIVEMVSSWIRDQRQIWILPVQLSVSRAGTVVVLLAGPWAFLIISPARLGGTSSAPNGEAFHDPPAIPALELQLGYEF